MRINTHFQLASHCMAALVLASASSGSLAAATFQYRHYVPGLTVSATPATQQAAAAILMTLSGGPSLPAGEVGWSYSYDLKQLLQVSGDATYSAASVSWSVSAGELPPGLALGSDGVISGTPAAKNTAGSTFQVLAAYKTTTGQQAYTIVVNGALLHVTQISAGNGHTCAITTTGGAKCWGNNSSGQLGDNSTTNRLTPVDVFGLTSGVTQISAGTSHTCAVTTTGGAKCWGYNQQGQLGDYSVTNRLAPVDVYGFSSGMAQISVGDAHTCAVTTGGGAKCWGYNGGGRLGDNSTTARSSPRDVYGLTSGVSLISAGANHSCAVTTAGGAKCWGSGSSGQLGENSTLQRQVPVDVSGLTVGALKIAAGANFTCAVTTAGGAKCWGLNSNGQLGDGTTTSSKGPVDVGGLSSGVVSLVTGGAQACVVTTAGGAKCWGLNSNGQLGDGTLVQRNAPVDVVGLSSGVTNISSGGGFTCAVTAGSAKCWGLNSLGQLGDGTTTTSGVPVDVAN